MKKLILPMIFLSIFSCSNMGYRGQIKDKTRIIMTELKSGDFSSVKGLKQQIERLNKTDKKEFKDSLTRLNIDKISVDKVNDSGLVGVVVQISTDDLKRDLFFQFKQIDDNWNITEEIRVVNKVVHIGKIERTTY